MNDFNYMRLAAELVMRGADWTRKVGQNQGCACDESIKMVIKKIIGILEEIEHREISAQDIQDILLKKYGLQPSPPQENM